jgi:hypothetical protein
MLSKATLLSAVLVISLSPSLQAHDIYSHLVDEVGASCCDDQDCRPVPYRFIATGVQMFVDKRWINVPSDRIQYRSLPGDTGETGGGHWCGSTYPPDFSDGGALSITKCAILPPQSADAGAQPMLPLAPMK